MIRPVFLLTSFFLLSGCATTDWAAINKQVRAGRCGYRGGPPEAPLQIYLHAGA